MPDNTGGSVEIEIDYELEREKLKATLLDLAAKGIITEAEVEYRLRAAGLERWSQ